MRFILQRRYFFHVLFWVMYAVFILLETQGYTKRKGFLFTLGPLSVFFILTILLVYGNILYLIPRLLEKKRIAWYITGIVVFVGLYTYIRSLNQKYWDAIVWPEDPMTIRSYFQWNLLDGGRYMIISSMLYFTQKWVEQRQQVKNIQINQLQTELKYLRAQVNPHFLFNGLNTIYGSIDMNNHQARDILLQFSDLLRYNLYEADVDWVPLEKEALYLQNYVALQKARSNSNLQTELDISIEDNTIKIAPLIFIVFVENAFKFSTREDNGINSIKIRLQQKDRGIVFECSNSYETDMQDEGGIGLNNVKRRLELLYKDKYTLDIRKDESAYSVHLTLFV